MLRLFIEIALVIVPFILYAVFLIFKKRDWKERAHWQGKPFVLLTIAGVMLALFTLAYSSTLFHKGDLTQVYLPARMENGVFKPAEWVKAK